MAKLAVKKSITAVYRSGLILDWFKVFTPAQASLELDSDPISYKENYILNLVCTLMMSEKSCVNEQIKSDLQNLPHRYLEDVPKT